MHLILRVMFCLSVLLAPTIGYAFKESANSCSHCNKEAKVEKIYLEPEQVIVSKEGLFIKIYDAFFQIPKLHSDVAGIYVPARYIEANKLCPKDHVIYCKCGGCCDRICMYRCRCGER